MAGEGPGIPEDGDTEWPVWDEVVPDPPPPPPAVPPASVPSPPADVAPDAGGARSVLLGVAILAVALLGVGAFLALRVLDDGDTTAPPDPVPAATSDAVATRAVSVFDLAAGICFDDGTVFDEDEVEQVPVVDCAAPHDNEIYAAFDLPDGEFPGSDEVDELGNEGCLDRFPAFVGIDYASSRYVVSTIYPTASSWEDGDREIICFLYDIDFAKLTGSAEGTAE